MKLYLEKRGCDFWELDESVRESDLGNYRLFMEFIDREGKRVCGDVSCGPVRKECWNKHKTQKNGSLFRKLAFTHTCSTKTTRGLGVIHFPIIPIYVIQRRMSSSW